MTIWYSNLNSWNQNYHHWTFWHWWQKSSPLDQAVLLMLSSSICRIQCMYVEMFKSDVGWWFIKWVNLARSIPGFLSVPLALAVDLNEIWETIALALTIVAIFTSLRKAFLKFCYFCWTTNKKIVGRSKQYQTHKYLHNSVYFQSKCVKLLDNRKQLYFHSKCHLQDYINMRSRMSCRMPTWFFLRKNLDC